MRCPGLPPAESLARFTVAARRWILPDTSVDIAWVEGRLDVIGPMSHARPTRYAVGAEVMLLTLAPVEAAHWLGAPLGELLDATVPLDAIDPRLAARLGDLLAAGRGGELVGAAAIAPGERAAAAARLLSAGVRVASVAAAVNLSERQLERDFARVTGLAPKRFARITRLRRAVTAAKRGVSLAEAALIGGYADQAHLTREVRALTGLTPAQILPDVGNVQDLSPRPRISTTRDRDWHADAS